MVFVVSESPNQGYDEDLYCWRLWLQGRQLYERYQTPVVSVLQELQLSAYMLQKAPITAIHSKYTNQPSGRYEMLAGGRHCAFWKPVCAMYTAAEDYSGECNACAYYSISSYYNVYILGCQFFSETLMYAYSYLLLQVDRSFYTFLQYLTSIDNAASSSLLVIPLLASGHI
jgi:hypothetical protein